MTDPLDLRRRLIELGSRYLQRTAGEAEELRNWISRWEAGESHALKEIEIIAHRMRGSGAMFGFSDVSETAGAVETWVVSYVERGGVVNPEALAILRQLIAAVQNAVNTAQKMEKSES
ncbi:MAG: Hpt domain-containing protein [Candidatus Obscuribacterales bacterium]|nr:Hpt domain-containing protein [Steroidobacteraceae bacterium]